MDRNDVNEPKQKRRRRSGVVPGSGVMETRQAAEFLGAHIETVRRMARRGELPAYKIGRDWRFSKETLTRWRETHRIRQRIPLVLAVDDEKSIRQTVSEFLQGAGYRVVTAENGTRALETARQEIPDLVLLDLVMPGMSGVDVLQALRSMDPDLPVVIVTGYPDSRLMAEAMRFAPVTLLSKPVDKEALLKAVFSLLD